MREARILVVDDEPQIRRVVCSMLATKGYEVVDASTGEDALKLLRSEKYDLVLLDNILPGITGIEVCREIRADSDMAIIVMSAGHRTKAQALNAGANDYLKKPFGVSELFACVDSNLKRGEPESTG
jgi:DNA-binding response OmpR family regulator